MNFTLSARGKLLLLIGAVFIILSPFIYSFSSDGLIEPSGDNIAADFGALYLAGSLSNEGNPASVYDWQVLTQKFDRFFGLETGGMTFSYPPPVLFPFMALSKLPYRSAAFIWMAGGLLTFAFMLRNLDLSWKSTVIILALPGVGMNLSTGQVDLYFIAALGAGLTILDRRPLMAGVLLGLVGFKPQLAVLIPIVLLLTGRWQTLLASAVTFIGINLIAVLTFEPSIWPAFLQNLENSVKFLEGGALKTFRMPSLYIYLTNLGIEIWVARIIHYALAIAVTISVVLLWRKIDKSNREGRLMVQSLILMAATPLISPYVYDYDLVILVPPVIWIWKIAYVQGWKHNEHLWLLLTVITAWLPNVVTEKLGFHPGLVAVFILLFLGFRIFHESYRQKSENL